MCKVLVFRWKQSGPRLAKQFDEEKTSERSGGSKEEIRQDTSTEYTHRIQANEACSGSKNDP
jgi:hypothetical protein